MNCMPFCQSRKTTKSLARSSFKPPAVCRSNWFLCKTAIGGWLVLLSTDLALTDAEIVRIYGMRWSIETFFKFAKSYLKLGTEFQGRSFDMLISHTTIVFARYKTPD